MKKFDPTQMSYFTGTEKYYRISRRHLLTDGTNYLAEKAGCFWMMVRLPATLARLALRTDFDRLSLPKRNRYEP